MKIYQSQDGTTYLFEQKFADGMKVQFEVIAETGENKYTDKPQAELDDMVLLNFYDVSVLGALYAAIEKKNVAKETLQLILGIVQSA